MAAERELYDAIVIGAGIQGCFTAYHLAKHSKKILLLEQVPCPLCTPDLRDSPFLLPAPQPPEAFLEPAGGGVKDLIITNQRAWSSQILCSVKLSCLVCFMTMQRQFHPP